MSGRTEGNLESVEERDGTARTEEERIVEGRDGVRRCNNEDKRQVKVRDERWRKEWRAGKKERGGWGEEDQMAADDCPPLHRNPGASIS